MYDGDRTNDFLKSDGQMYVVDSKLLVKGKQKGKKTLFPNPFSKSWRYVVMVTVRFEELATIRNQGLL